MYKVLMVCTGNICRSPTAEYVLRAQLAAAGLGDAVSVASAGTHDYHIGEAADPRTIKAARRRGLDLGPHIARQVMPADFSAYDLMLAADDTHLRHLASRRPARARAELKLLLDYAPGQGLRELPDPYFGGVEGFELVLDLCALSSAGLLESLAKAPAR